MTSFAKKIGSNVLLGPHLLRKVSNMQKSNALTKLYLAYFFKSDYKIASKKKLKTSRRDIFEKRSM